MSRIVRCLVFLVVVLTTVGRGSVLRAAPPAPLPCATEALAAIADIRTLVGVLGFTGGPLNALESKLDAAERSIAKGNLNSASGQLGALRNQVEALAGRGDIGPADAQALLEAIDAALEIVRTCSGVPRLGFFNVRSGHGENTLFWVNPATPGYAQTRVLFRTDTHPTGPADPAATLLGAFAGAPGAVGRAPHTALVDGTTYFYAAFAQNNQGMSSAAKTSRGRPDDTSTPFLWSYTIGRSVPIASVSRNFLYSAFSDDALHAMAPGSTGGGWPTGWTPTRIPAPADARPAGPLSVVIGGMARAVIFASSRTGHMYAVDAAAGGLLWTSPDLGGAIVSSPSGTFLPPSQGGGFLLFVGVQRPDGSGKFYALKAVDGQVAWSFDDGGALGAVSTQPSVGTSSRIYFTSRARGSSDTVWCLSYTASTATVAWSANPGDVNTSPTVRTMPFPALYVGTTAGEVHAFHLDNHDPLWLTPYNTGDGPVSRFVFSDRFTNRLYLSTANRSQAIEDHGAAPQAVWSIPLPSPSVPIRFVDFIDNDVYVAAGDGCLYKIDDVSTSPTPTCVPVGDPAKPAALGQLTFDTALSIVTMGSADGIVYALTVPLSP